MTRVQSAALFILAALVGACGSDQVVETVGTTSTVQVTTTTVEPTTTTESPTTTTKVPTPTTARVRATTTVPPAPRTTLVPPASPATTGAGACGGDLPPCSVMRRESDGSPTAIGYGQCGDNDCYGKWQIDPDTAESVGYPRRMDLQPESVQDEAARAILARDGCGAWSTC